MIRDLAKELAELQQSPVEGVRVELNEENVADIRAELQGPGGGRRGLAGLRDEQRAALFFSSLLVSLVTPSGPSRRSGDPF